MKICVDLDGVICELRDEGQSYAELQPIPGAIDRLRQLRDAGHYIIIYSARHFETCAGNVGQVLARQGLTTLSWLERYGVVYDEIHFGKPYADVYIDDHAYRFGSWAEIEADGGNLPQSREYLRDQSRCSRS